eukprot:scaffold1127_cov160-Amphora_coffeaeformis.AAC.10
MALVPYTKITFLKRGFYLAILIIVKESCKGHPNPYHHGNQGCHWGDGGRSASFSIKSCIQNEKGGVPIRHGNFAVTKIKDKILTKIGTVELRLTTAVGAVDIFAGLAAVSADKHGTYFIHWICRRADGFTLCLTTFHYKLVTFVGQGSGRSPA